ncbi:MAG: hypothetical protein KAG66_11880, partial [Methylococcales bacterium]|nr:hypothetical protein [Methylococcales bacterium]
MIRNISVSLLAFLFLATGAYAQTLTLNPLSTFGVGEIAPSTGARNMSMGDLEVGTFNYASINRLNPASYTDLLYSTLDVSGFTRYSTLKSATDKANSFTAGFQNLAYGFPSNKGPSVVFGFAPRTAAGYELKEDHDFSIGDTTVNTTETQRREGGLNQAFLGLGAHFLHRRLSVGANYYFSFGNLTHKSNIQFNGDAALLYSGLQVDRSAFLKGSGIQLGIMYTDTIAGRKSSSPTAVRKPVTLIRFSTNIDNGFELKGDRVTIYNSIYVSDTIAPPPGTAIEDTRTEAGTALLPKRMGVGLTLTRLGAWEISAEYSTQDWKSMRYFNDENLLSPVSHIALGGEWIPDFGARSFFKRVAYRSGVQFNKSYILK